MNTSNPSTRIGQVALTVSNLERSIDFYRASIGFQMRTHDGKSARLGVGGEDLLVLHEDANASRPTGPATGLFHFAILVPSRGALADTLGHLVDGHVELRGAADHLVSEALYLADPEGNGIEIYRDRPREEWSYRNGQLQMTTDPLNLDRLFAESTAEPPWAGLPMGTVIGHMHLRVADIPSAEAFYREQIGFALTTRYGRSASFLAAGGYHHHIGINTWESLGAPSPPVGSLGLRSFQIRFADHAELSQAKRRLADAGCVIEAAEDGMQVRDPSGNAAVLAIG